MLERTSLFIGGRWVSPSSKALIEVISPSTEKPVGFAVAGGLADVDAAVTAAANAGRSGWATCSQDVRADLLDAFAAALTRRAQETALLVTTENGMPISLSNVVEGSSTAGLLRYYAGLIRENPLECRRPAHSGRGSTVVRHEPAGVIAAIVPWNFPQSLTMVKLAPALAAGCTVVLKPAPETVLDAFVFADAAQEAGLPPGVINIVTGGVEIGRALVEHSAVDKVSFTGSTAAGRWIAETCGRLLRPAGLELGGKSAAIVLDDADLDKAMRGLARAALTNAGQTCWSSTRILAPRQRYREVVDAVAAMVGSLTVGDPFDPSTALGPLVSAAQRARVEQYVDYGKRTAELITGGSRPAGLDTGWYVEPTVFADVDADSRLFREEIFGPVLTISRYDGEDDAVRLANDSNYGLAGTVWTSDEDRGLAIARRVETGSIGVNNFDLDMAAPFGGMKSSGLGRELGPEGLGSYLRAKSIYLRSIADRGTEKGNRDDVRNQ